MFILGRGMAPEGKEIVANRTKMQQRLSNAYATCICTYKHTWIQLFLYPVISCPKMHTATDLINIAYQKLIDLLVYRLTPASEAHIHGHEGLVNPVLVGWNT